MLFTRFGLWEAWEEGSIQVLGHEGSHVFRGLGGRKSFEKELQIGPGFDFVGFGGFHQGEQHGAGIRALGGSGEEPISCPGLQAERLSVMLLDDLQDGWFFAISCG